MKSKNFSKKIAIGMLLAAVLASCTTSGYWVPPSAPPTPVQYNELQGGYGSGSDFAFSNSQSGQSLEPQSQNGVAPVSDILNPNNPSEEFEHTEAVQSAATDQQNTNVGSPADPENSSSVSSFILYQAQAADTLPVVAVRFGVAPSEINSPESIPETGFINPGQLLVIPRRLEVTSSSEQLIPDSEVVYSPSTVSFDIAAFVQDAGGYLSKHKEFIHSTGTISGAEAVLHAAKENSMNPRLLLALLEFHSGWVYGHPDSSSGLNYPLGIELPTERYLYNQLVWTMNQLSIGYYAYREGRLTQIDFKDGSSIRLSPALNAGTVALQYYFAQFYQGEDWENILYSDNGFLNLYNRMFGDPWKRADNVEPLYPIDTKQPSLILPFERNWTWSLTGGPHGAWEHEGAYAALDFGPGIQSPGCVESGAWVLAASDGLVVRTGEGLVVLDLDGDGHEQTGWVLVYLHVSSDDRIPLGSWVAKGDRLGHPSCEGGFATGTHLHLARKYNGEWVPADGALSFNLGGWIAHAGDAAYQGTMTRGDDTIVACTCSNARSFITRGNEDP